MAPPTVTQRNAASILVVDDKEQMRNVLRKFLSAEGYAVETAADADAALSLLEQKRFSLILSDIKMPGMDGNELLDYILLRDPEAIVILMTAFGSIEAAVSAIKHGAADYVSKPFELEEVLLRIERALKERKLEKRVAELEKKVAAQEATHSIIGQSAAVKQLRQIIERVAPLDDIVLITGETGTGKELVARALHNLSPRASKPFIALDCSSIPETLIESELFGHERGTFTGATESRAGLFETASDGTLFLDEVETLSSTVQAKLLRVLQERTLRRVGGRKDIVVRARIIAATNRDLNEAVEVGEFRRDLYYRIAVIPINVPPLRERHEDVPELISHFLVRRAKERGTGPSHFTPEAMQLLTAYDFPGNVRELENIVSYLTAMGDEIISIENLPQSVMGGDVKRKPREEFRPESLADVERRHILQTLESVGGNRIRAAALLGIDRRTLYSKLLQYGMAERKS